MSNKLIILWGSIVVILLSAVLAIGLKYKSELKYIELKEYIKDKTNEYISIEKVDLPLEITSEELETKGYIDELQLEDKICAADIKVEKLILFKKYDINFTCITKEEKNSDQSLDIEN